MSFFKCDYCGKFVLSLDGLCWKCFELEISDYSYPLMRLRDKKLVGRKEYIELRNKYLIKQDTGENKKLLKLAKNMDDCCCG